jgi:hypothetical protein
MATVLLLPEDELALQAAVTAEYPGLRIVDAAAPWPLVRDSVLDVERTALLWVPEIQPRLPKPRFTGYATRAPQAGRVVTWRRSLCSDGDVLTSGMVSAVVWHGMDPGMVRFMSTVWRALVRATSDHLVRWIEDTGQEQRMPSFHIGHHALAAARDGRIGLHTSVGPLYPPSQDKARGAAW